MNFLPRRRGQSFGGLGRMRSTFRRRSGFIPVKKPIHTNYIDVSTPVGLAAGTDANYTLLLAADTPNKALVSDMAAVISQCENNSRVVKKGSFLNLSFLATTAPSVVGIWVYLNTRGNVTAPVDSDDFSQTPGGLSNTRLRAQTIFYRHFPLDINAFRTIRIPLGSKRNNYLQDASSIVIVVDNLSATAAIEFIGYGRIRTIEG